MDRQMSDKNSPANNISDPSQSHFDGANALYLEQQYARYKAGDASLDAGWKSYFAALDDGIARIGQAGNAMIGHRKLTVT